MDVTPASSSATASVPPAEVLDVLSAVPTWWARRAGRAGLTGDWLDWRRALPSPPCDFGTQTSRALAGLSAYALGERYVCALPHQERFRHGRHYTPRALAEVLWKEIERSARVSSVSRIVDPAAGAGSLLLPPVRRFVRSTQGCDASAAIDAAASRFKGIDNDALAAWLGSVVLAAELLPLWARVPEHQRRPLPALIVTGDGLRFEPASADIVVMNPPYGRASLDGATRSRWADSLHGHANWYGIFLHAAVERAAPGGVVAAVLPTSFLGGAYYQRLRGFLHRHAPLERLRRVDDRSGVFASGVLQETCLAVFRKGGVPGPVACSTQAMNGRVRSVRLGFTPLTSSEPDLPWMLPRSRPDRVAVRVAATYPNRLRDYGWKASTGPLVWNRHKPQIGADRDSGAVPILWAADLEMYCVRRSAVRDRQRWITLRERDEFMRLTEPVVLVQRTTAPEQPRRLVAATLSARVLEEDWGGELVVENHVNVLRCEHADSPLSPELLTSLLNSDPFDRLYRCITGTVAVSAYELEALPLPSAELLRGWSRLGRSELTAAVSAAFA